MSGVMDSVRMIDGEKLVVHNAQLFCRGLRVEVWREPYGLLRGEFTVANSPKKHEPLLADQLPLGTQVGDLLVLRSVN